MVINIGEDLYNWMTFIIDGQILCLVFKLYLVFFLTEKKNIFYKSVQTQSGLKKKKRHDEKKMAK